MTVFLAVSGTLYQNFSLLNVGPVLPDAKPGQIANLIAGTASQTYKDLSPESKALVIPQITDAMRNIWLFFVVGAALSLVLSMFMGVSGDARCACSVYGLRADLFPDAADKTVSGWCCRIALTGVSLRLNGDLVPCNVYVICARKSLKRRLD